MFIVWNLLLICCVVYLYVFVYFKWMLLNIKCLFYGLMCFLFFCYDIISLNNVFKLFVIILSKDDLFNDLFNLFI